MLLRPYALCVMKLVHVSIGRLVDWWSSRSPDLPHSSGALVSGGKHDGEGMRSWTKPKTLKWLPMAAEQSGDVSSFCVAWETLLWVDSMGARALLLETSSFVKWSVEGTRPTRRELLHRQSPHQQRRKLLFRKSRAAWWHYCAGDGRLPELCSCRRERCFQPKHAATAGEWYYSAMGICFGLGCSDSGAEEE